MNHKEKVTYIFTAIQVLEARFSNPTIQHLEHHFFMFWVFKAH
jgi:hypothetical protein